MLTIIASEQVVENRLETKDTQNIPRDRGHPLGIHISRSHTSLQHALELDSQWERQTDYSQSAVFPHPTKPDSLITNPLKNALIQPIIKVCGMIIVIFPFIIPIMPSIAAGSDIGLGAACPFLSGSFKYVPASY